MWLRNIGAIFSTAANSQWMTYRGRAMEINLAQCADMGDASGLRRVAAVEFSPAFQRPGSRQQRESRRVSDD